MYTSNPWWPNNNGGGNPEYPPDNTRPPQNAGQRLARFNSPPSQIPTIAGRIVNGPGDIAPDEVPMNGELSVFPQADLSCIYAKGWTDHGITTVRYIPEQRMIEETQRPAVIPEDFRKTLFERLDAIEAALPKPKQAQKKEEKASG